MGYYEAVADLPLSIEESSRTRQDRDTSSGFVRATTTVTLHGDGHAGRGEDVCYDTADHDALADAPPFVGEEGLVAPGEYTVDSFSAALDDVDLFPTAPPERESARHYRRWALESAALDLALRRAGESLGDALGLSYGPVRFVVSTRLSADAGGDSGDAARTEGTSDDGDTPPAPTTDRVDALLERDPGMEFKLDPTPEWTDAVIGDLAATGAVRVLDLKGHYQGTSVETDPDPDLYERLVSSFPGAVLEDPALTPETELVLDDHRDRIAWDAPITGVESVEGLPFEPRWLNVKPSRFGTVESLFETLEYCGDRGMRLYGGGQFELDVGRPQIQLLASLFYPDGPNDVAPGGYNDPDPPADLPGSPLDPDVPAAGLGP